jgi:hypothetical protein
VDQQARDEITAAAAAHRELGPRYDDAVAEGLVERIGDEIDKRVDARLAQRGETPVQRGSGRGGQVGQASSPSWPAIYLALGSMTIGGFTAAGVLSAGGNAAVVALIWIIIGVINVAHTRRR